MFSREIRIFFIFCYLSFLFFLGCSPISGETIVWKDKNFSFVDYDAFEIQPVFNKTGKFKKEDLSLILSNHLKKQFKLNNLEIIDSPLNNMKALKVRSVIQVYDPYDPAGDTRFGNPSSLIFKKALSTVNTQLLEPSKNQIVAELNITVETGSTGDYSGDPHNFILKAVAEEVAKEIAKIMQSKKPK